MKQAIFPHKNYYYYHHHRKAKKNSTFIFSRFFQFLYIQFITLATSSYSFLEACRGKRDEDDGKKKK